MINNVSAICHWWQLTVTSVSTDKSVVSKYYRSKRPASPQIQLLIQRVTSVHITIYTTLNYTTQSHTNCSYHYQYYYYNTSFVNQNQQLFSHINQFTNSKSEALMYKHLHSQYTEGWINWTELISWSDCDWLTAVTWPRDWSAPYMMQDSLISKLTEQLIINVNHKTNPIVYVRRLPNDPSWSDEGKCVYFNHSKLISAISRWADWADLWVAELISQQISQ